MTEIDVGNTAWMLIATALVGGGLAGLALAATWGSRGAGMRGWPLGTPCMARESPPATLKA